MNVKSKTVLSGVQPSSTPHLGNYLGAIKNWIDLQKTFQCYFCAVDLHSITVPQDPEKLREHTYQMIAFYLAFGLDPEEATLFLQSQVSEHAELSWILTCFTYLGELGRMHQFKDKSQRAGSGDSISAGLFTYPILMAADILLYGAHYVPVGDDQKQHVELTRNIALRFNNRFQKEVFVVPEPMIKDGGARVMDLQDPSSKMSKSAPNLSGVIFFDDNDKTLEKKIKSSVTDSGNSINPENASPGLQNLIEIFASLQSRPKSDVWKDYSGKMYGHLKVDLAAAVIDFVKPIRSKTFELMKDKGYLDQILKQGAEKAKSRAAVTLTEVYTCVGFVR